METKKAHITYRWTKKDDKLKVKFYRKAKRVKVSKIIQEALLRYFM